MSDLKLALGWNRMNLRILGIWPDPVSPEKPSLLSKYHVFLSGVILSVFILIPQTTNLFLISGDLEMMTETLSKAVIPCSNAFFKFLAVVYNQKALRAILRSFTRDWHNSSKTAEERATMLVDAKLAKNISICCTLLTLAMVTIYFCLRFAEISKMDRKNVEDQTNITPYPGYFPYSLRRSPTFELTCLGQIFSAYCGIFAYSGVDSFIYMLVLHVCGQFKNLRKKLGNLVAEKYGDTTPAKFRRELVWIVKRHEHLNWFAKTIEDSFNVLLLIQMLFCTIELCFHGFNAFQIFSEPDRENLAGEVLLLVTFVGFTVIHLYIYCYVGEMLLVQSTDIGITAYEAQWFNVPAKEAKCLLFIIFRSTHPLRLTAGKFGTFSMEMFSNILRTSLGYLSVLLTVTSSID